MTKVLESFVNELVKIRPGRANRKMLVKDMWKEVEHFKIAVRNERRDSNEQIKKDANLTDDDKKYYEGEIQNIIQHNDFVIVKNYLSVVHHHSESLNQQLVNLWYINN